MSTAIIWQAACVLGLLCLAVATLAGPADRSAPFRPPAVPLVTHDPYFSVWSMADRLTDDWTRHWTGAPQALYGMARIDGVAYRFAGPEPPAVPPMKQVSVEVQPTRTLYVFEAGGIRLALTFLTPALPDDLDVLSRPVTYVEWEARAVDGQSHTVSLYLDATAEWVVNTRDQEVVWTRHKAGDLSMLSIGTKEQPVLAKKGDNLRIDWGHLYLAVPYGGSLDVIADAGQARPMFAATGRLPEVDDSRMPRAAQDAWPTLACALELGKVGARPVSRYVMLAYDDGYSIEYLGRKLRPWWRRGGMEVAELLSRAAAERPELEKRCAKLDREMMADLTKAGGEKYARLAALCFRQCLAAHKLAAGPGGEPMFFSKECFSNGCIATVDVTYPSAPLLLLTNTRLLRALLAPVMEYAASPRWKFPFAPHDVGTYPLANGQVYGGGEETEENQMPVEECGNLLILVTALARIEGNASYALCYWPALTKWADYLRAKGLDPENQLCTDDFAGHLAHNANLSLKAIVALGGYAELCKMLGKAKEAADCRRLAKRMAAEWARMADDGDHFRLAFDKPGSWSQKYNLVWDRLLGLKLFAPEVARKEMAFYRAHQEKYGLPLDNRQPYTKLDWVVWTATLTGSREDFEALLSPVYDLACETPDRVPMTDWFWTTTGKRAGFQARTVVGGVYIPLLANTSTWRKWARRAGR